MTTIEYAIAREAGRYAARIVADGPAALGPNERRAASALIAAALGYARQEPDAALGPLQAAAVILDIHCQIEPLRAALRRDCAECL